MAFVIPPNGSGNAGLRVTIPSQAMEIQNADRPRMRRLSGRGPILGYAPGQLLPDVFVTGAVRLRKPGFDSGEPFLAQSRLGLGYAQLRMRCGESALAIREQFLVELFPGPQSGELDPDVLPAEPREPDHVARDIDDSDRLPHFHDEDLPAPAHPSCLQDELGGLGNRHEIARHFGGRDRDGPAAGDLLAKLGNNPAGAAEDVSESDYAETRAAGALDFPAYLLGQALRGAHDVGRVHRHVGRHQYEFFAAVIA